MIRFLLLTVLALALSAPNGSSALGKEYMIAGKTMGTYYRIKFIPPSPVSRALWDKKVKIRLKEVNARLSIFQKDSEISRFNAAPAHRPFKLSRDFHQVLVQCRRLYTLTGGAWDGTVKPLVDLWGFGTREKTDTLPDPDAIAAALERTGFARLSMKDRTLTKTGPGISLDLGSIAKGYGVDEIARLFKEGGIEDYLVEIGGELAGSGKNKKGKPWAVGISAPEKSALATGLYQVVSLDNMAIATSGNYRNFFEIKDKTYSHIIHPRTGYPVDNMVVSASVIAPDCTLADGLATALMVMDTREGLNLINGMAQVECLIIRKEGNTLVPERSAGFSALETAP